MRPAGQLVRRRGWLTKAESPVEVLPQVLRPLRRSSCGSSETSIYPKGRSDSLRTGFSQRPEGFRSNEELGGVGVERPVVVGDPKRLSRPHQTGAKPHQSTAEPQEPSPSVTTTPSDLRYGEAIRRARPISTLRPLRLASPGPRPGWSPFLQGTGTASVSSVPSAEMERRSCNRLRPASPANAVSTSPF